MIEASEFAAKIQAILNGTDSSVLGLSRPDFELDRQSVTFSVRSPSLPYADTIAGAAGHVLPVMAELGSGGQYEAYPGIGMWSASATLTFIFPVSAYQDILLFYEYMADALVGKLISFGPLSGFVLCTIGQPTYGQMRYLEATQYEQVKQAAALIFGKVACVSREWASLTFPVYMSGAKNLGASGGLIFGNQQSDTLTIAYNGVTYSEPLAEISPSESSSANTYEGQSVSAPFQSGLATNQSIGATHTVFVRMTDFWLAFRQAWAAGSISSIPATLTSVISTGAGTAWHNAAWPLKTNCIIKDVSFMHDPGKPLTCTFTVEPLASVGSV